MTAARPARAGHRRLPAEFLGLFLARSRAGFALAAAAGAASGLSTAGLVAIVNRVLRDRLVWSPATLACFVALCLVRLGCGLLSQVVLIRLSQRTIAELRVGLCRQIMAAPLRQVEDVGAHRLIASLTDDMLHLSNIVVNIPYTLVNGAVLSGCLVYLGWLSPPALAGILVCLAVGTVTYIVPVAHANRELRAARQAQDRFFAQIRSLLAGVKELKLHDPKARDFFESLQSAADAVRARNVRGITIYSTAANWSRLSFFAYAGLLVFAFPHLLNVADATAVAGYVIVVLYMMAPLEAVMNVLPHLALADTALRQVRDLCRSLHAEPAAVANAADVDWAGWRRIDFRGVSYRYPGEQGPGGFTVAPLDLHVRRGQVVFLIGGNGCGKSTMVRLLTGLYEPSAGNITVDGRPVGAGGRAAYRQLFSCVFADYHLFDRMFGLAADAHLDDQAVGWLKRLGLEHKVTLTNGVFSTTVLSSGQRKRLALLAAILEDRSFYVFDEWAADQDPAFKDVFYREIIPWLRSAGKAALVVTHDHRYLHLADRVLEMQDGRLRELAGEGSHVEAMPVAAGGSTIG